MNVNVSTPAIEADRLTKHYGEAVAVDGISLEIPRAGGMPGPITRLMMHFTTITPGPVIPLLRDGETVTTRQLWTLTGWDGGFPADSTDPRAPRT